MPQLGETVTEGTILRWVKQVGDSVAEDDVLVEISTDKVDTEVPSPAAGVILEILVAEGETVPVGAALVIIGAPGSVPQQAGEPAAAPDTAAPDTAAAVSAPAQAVSMAGAGGSNSGSPSDGAASTGSAASEDSGASRFLSPVVRKLAREHGIDVGALTGTGRNGRVTRNDVLAFIEAGGPAASPAAPPAAPEPAAAPAAPEPAVSSAPAESAAPAAPPAPAAPEAPAPVVPAASAGVPVAPSRRGDEIRELDRLRAAIGRNMIKAKQTAAHVWTSVEVDFERVERVRQAHKAQWKADEGFSLTYLPFIARATLDALRAYPVVNSSFYLEDNKAVFHHDINLGIAVDLNQAGLIVTSVRNADDLTLRGIARAIRSLADRSRAGKLEPDDISGSTFTITNPGPFGSYMSAPIINVPNVAILSTDTVTKRPTVVTTADGQDTIAIRHIGYLGLTWDHRAFDGSTAVLFLARIKENLENWDWEQQVI
jgi:2-oxoglutarate dehydrogenase E2 component (dihydrolipoamide succinyltransferase)